MAIPNTIGSFPYPHYNSPRRTMIQFYNSGATNAALRIVATNTSAYGKALCLTKINVGITNASAGASVVLKLAGDAVLNIPGTVNHNNIIDLFPAYIQSQTLATTTSTPCALVASGATVGMYCFVEGFYK